VKDRPTLDELEGRVEALEEDSHVPFDFTDLIARLEKLEREVKRLKGSLAAKKKVRSRS
jgi:hypothetical protein